MLAYAHPISRQMYIMQSLLGFLAFVGISTGTSAIEDHFEAMLVNQTRLYEDIRQLSRDMTAEWTPLAAIFSASKKLPLKLKVEFKHFTEMVNQDMDYTHTLGEVGEDGMVQVRRSDMEDSIILVRKLINGYRAVLYRLNVAWEAHAGGLRGDHIEVTCAFLDSSWKRWAIIAERVVELHARISKCIAIRATLTGEVKRITEPLEVSTGTEELVRGANAAFIESRKFASDLTSRVSKNKLLPAPLVKAVRQLAEQFRIDITETDKSGRVDSAATWAYIGVTAAEYVMRFTEVRNAWANVRADPSVSRTLIQRMLSMTERELATWGAILERVKAVTDSLKWATTPVPLSTAPVTNTIVDMATTTTAIVEDPTASEESTTVISSTTDTTTGTVATTGLHTTTTLPTIITTTAGTTTTRTSTSTSTTTSTESSTTTTTTKSPSTHTSSTTMMDWFDMVEEEEARVAAAALETTVIPAMSEQPSPSASTKSPVNVWAVRRAAAKASTRAPTSTTITEAGSTGIASEKIVTTTSTTRPEDEWEFVPTKTNRRARHSSR